MTTGNKEVVRSRPGYISNYESVIQSSFHFQSKDKHLSHINSVHSGFYALYHRKRIESCGGSYNIAGRTSLRAFVQAFVLPL